MGTGMGVRVAGLESEWYVLESPQEEGRARTGTHGDARFPWFTRVALKSLRPLKGKVRKQG